jgi:hypothetical protein
MVKSTEAWISCRVRPGMFSDERVVEVSGRSFFVEVGAVRQTSGDEGEVRVQIFDTNGKRRAVLPTRMSESVELSS